MSIMSTVCLLSAMKRMAWRASCSRMVSPKWATETLQAGGRYIMPVRQGADSQGRSQVGLGSMEVGFGLGGLLQA